MRSLPLYMSIVALAACTAPVGASLVTGAASPTVAFPPAEDDPFEKVQRRRWHNPVIADLDQDGRRDVITTDHGWASKVFWNQGNGHFANGVDIIVGDVHGIGVADFDGDGLIEAAVTRGGGSGTNSRNAKLFRFGHDRKITELTERNPALIKMRGRTAKWVDADQDGDLDLMLFGYVQRPQTKAGQNFVYENHGDGRLLLHSNLPKTLNDGEKTLVTDWNADGDPDFVRYGKTPLSFLQGEEGLAWTDVTQKIFGWAPRDVTSVVELDYDNDGDMDLFLARGSMPGRAETWYDPNTKRLGFHISRKAFQFPDLELGANLQISAYQAQYPDHEVWVGESEYKLQRERDADWHQTRNVYLNSSLALGAPDQTTQRGLHIGYVGNGTWRLAIDSFPPVTGVIEDVPDGPDSAHIEPLSDILLRNDHGHFVDVTKEAGLSVRTHSMAAAAADFNNDGLIDLFIVNRGIPTKGTQQSIWINKGEGTFIPLVHHGIESNEYAAFGIGGEAFDFDDDGWMDLLYGNERGLWHLHRNALGEKMDNGYVAIEVGVSPSARTSPQGALVTLEGCGVRQMRHVGATGAPYSQSFDTRVHFGIGQCHSMHTATVTWPNGEHHSFPATVNSVTATRVRQP